jgi:hypothetical protein
MQKEARDGINTMDMHFVKKKIKQGEIIIKKIFLGGDEVI